MWLSVDWCVDCCDCLLIDVIVDWCVDSYDYLLIGVLNNVTVDWCVDWCFRTWLIVLLVHSMLPHLGTIAVAPFIHALAVHKRLPFEEVISQGE